MRFAANPELILPPCPDGTQPAYHLYVLRFKEKSERLRVQMCSTLRDRDIFTQVHYVPVYLQPWFQGQFGYRPGKCPACESIYESCLSIPLFPHMTAADIQMVVETVSEITESSTG